MTDPATRLPGPIDVLQIEQSLRAAVPEVVGDAALVLPLDEASWASALTTVASRRDAMIAAGRVRAGSFSVAASGDDLASAYASVMRGSVA